ncbi:MAG: molybdopterin cofactor-binding domain-containing protein [Chloroflexota bacterium]|nr:molybdopterin cofactor-binding domain-containing protein [Chloroflexota bacterium]
MHIKIDVNGENRELEVLPDDTLLTILRRAGLYSIKHGCETGECGACAILLEGTLVNSCTLLAAQVDGKRIETLEGLAPELPGQRGDMHPLQRAFVDTGAIQCGYCTPAQILAAKALLEKEPTPTDGQIRQALAGVLCRCTGYIKPVEAVQRAAAVLRGEEVPPVEGPATIQASDNLFMPPQEPLDPPAPAPNGKAVDTRTKPKILVVVPPETQVVNKPEVKVDAVKLAKGRPVFSDDLELPGMLYGALLTSPHAHARIRTIDTSRAEQLPGVHAVLTHKNVPRVMHASGGQSYPNPHPYDQVVLDNKVRHYGDRVAVVAAETPEIAQEALSLIKVDYEVLPAVLDPVATMQPGAPVIHDEPDAIGIHDAQRNIVHQLDASYGDMEAGFAAADHIFEREYRTHQVQAAAIEPHVCITWWDEDDRLVVRTSTQVPFHVRRMLAPLIGLPVRRIRVIKPRLGGGFGVKQELLIEDLCSLLTIASGRPVRIEYTREQEFTSSRSRHPQVLRYKTGVRNDGTLTAMQLYMIGDTGAYGTHGLTVQMVAGFRGLTTYKADALSWQCDVVYTNRPTPGAYRGYGAPQALFALETHMEEIAVALDMDPVDFKRKNWVNEGDELVLARAMGEGREGFEQWVHSSGLEQCVQSGMQAIDWQRRNDTKWRTVPGKPHLRRGLGFAVCMHGSGIAGLDMAAASIKLNDDGSINLLVGATDLGTGSDTVLGQIAAETLGVPLEDVIVYSSDTDFTPFDTGAYASSTTYISGGAVLKAAEEIAEQILKHAAIHFFPKVDRERLWLEDRQVCAPGGERVSLETVALHATHQADQHQIMATASHMSYQSPPPFAAQFAEIEVDVQTGEVVVKQLVMAVDCGVAINPITAAGQVEGGMAQALGYAHNEEMAYDDEARLVTTDFRTYPIYRADEMPELGVILVQTYEPSGPYGAKAIAEIPKDGVAPALGSAIFDATGVRIRELPFTPERVWRALQDD